MSYSESKLKLRPSGRVFSEAFKKQVVREFEKGQFSKDQLMRRYGLKGKSAVLNWCRKYGKFAYPQQPFSGPKMKDPQQQRIKELEHKLRAAELKVLVYGKIIEITNRELDADTIKKIEAELSASWQPKKK
jgi:transposase-like protein